MKVVIEANDQYKNMLLEVAQAINARITFQENDFEDESSDHVKKGGPSTHADVMAKYKPNMDYETDF